MSGGLFRTEAVQAQREEELGTTGLHAPRMGWVALSIGVVSIGAIAGLLFFGTYTRHERVQGSLVPTGGLINVMPNAPGAVARILVQEGESVISGQPLAEITIPSESVSGGDTNAAVAAQLYQKRETLQSDQLLQDRLIAVQGEEIKDRLVNLNAQLLEKRSQQDLQEQRAESAERLYEEWRAIEGTGIVSRVQLLQQRDTALQHRATQRELASQILQIRQQIEESNVELLRLSSVLETQRNEIGRQLADIGRSLAENAALAGQVMRAPTGGVVTSVLLNPGQAVASGQTVLTMMPSESELFAELWVPTSAIGFVEVGKRVKIRYHAFPYQKFGQYGGVVSLVSRSATSPETRALLMGAPVSASGYRVEISLDRQDVMIYEKKEQLKPGMILEADISLEKRKLLEWVFEPIYSISMIRRAADQDEDSAE